jgi:hypothetical protein
VTIGIYDSSTGAKLSTYTLPAIGANGHLMFSMNAIESLSGIAPGSRPAHYIIKAETPSSGYLQHLVNNQQAGAMTVLTASCTLTAY